MRQDPRNPNTNSIPKSIKEEDLIKGIELSGYPLQGLVADKMKSEFPVIEEWGYIDRETNIHRSLDVFGYKNLTSSKDSKINSSHVILAECKKSAHPYIFFKNITAPRIPGFPLVAGLFSGFVSISQKTEQKAINIEVVRALGLDKLEYIENGPPFCSAFSQAILSGNKVKKLSGDEPFNKVVLPLVNAIDHAKYMYSNKSKILYPKLLLSIGVLDAPMMVVESPSKVSDPVLTPWVRVIRQESSKDVGSKPSTFYGIDMVHIDYFDEFLNKQAVPFAKEFGDRCCNMSDILYNGGEVDDLDDWSWDKIQPRKREYAP